MRLQEKTQKTKWLTIFLNSLQSKTCDGFRSPKRISDLLNLAFDSPFIQEKIHYDSSSYLSESLVS
ncbi:hypothetical protein, partial [uncultured Gimesia sp.]|uniref:hypothetical protein n=1 Tax=uncultured Gimesia sp. TaxID=1678688 RepID=UPI00261654B6